MVAFYLMARHREKDAHVQMLEFKGVIRLEKAVGPDLVRLIWSELSPEPCVWSLFKLPLFKLSTEHF